MPYIRVPKLSGSHPLELDNAVQVRLFWQINSVACFNVLGGRVAGGFVNSQTHADDLTAAVLAVYATSGLGARQSTNTLLLGVGIRDVRTRNLVEYFNTNTGTAGTGSAEPLPNQLAAVVTLRTEFAGKSYRGRLYFSGADEDQNTSQGLIEGAYNTALVAFVTAVSGAMADEGITLSVLSAPRYANLTPPLDIQTWPGAITPVVAGGILTRDTQWDTQRRRKS